MPPASSSRPSSDSPTALATHEPAGTSETPYGWQCRLHQHPQPKFPKRQPRSIKDPPATDREVDAFLLQAGGKLPRSPFESLSCFSLHKFQAESLFHRLAHSFRRHLVRELFVELSEVNSISAIHSQIFDVQHFQCQRCLSVQHRALTTDPACVDSCLSFPSRRKQANPIVSTLCRLQPHRRTLQRTISEMRLPFLLSDMSLRSDHNFRAIDFDSTTLRRAPAPSLSIHTLLAQATADVECAAG